MREKYNNVHVCLRKLYKVCSGGFTASKPLKFYFVHSTYCGSFVERILRDKQDNTVLCKTFFFVIVLCYCCGCLYI